jgi:hypothetical protein
MALEPTTPVLRDQLLSSADPACVRVIWPRGSKTLLVFNNAGERVTDPNETSLDKDGAWQRAKITDDGDVLWLSDTPDSVPALVKGEGLK